MVGLLNVISSTAQIYVELPPISGLSLLKTSVKPVPSVAETVYPLPDVSKSIVVVAAYPKHDNVSNIDIDIILIS